MHKTGLGVAVAVVVGLGATGAVAAAALSSSNDPPPDRTQTHQVTSNDPSYWNQDRMASARPAPLPADPAAPAGGQPTDGPTPPTPAGSPTH